MESFTGYLQWEEWYDEQKELEAAEAKRLAQTEADKVRTENNKGKKLSFKEKFEFENMEATIQGLEAKLTHCQAEAEKPDVVVNAKRLQELYGEIGALQAQIEKLYARWNELEARAGN